MPSLLDAETTAIAPDALSGWQAADRCLLRTVTVPAGEDALLRSVHQTSEQLNHHPVTHVDGDTVTFQLSTAGVGGISDLDVARTARIDQVLSGSQATGTDPAEQ